MNRTDSIQEAEPQEKPENWWYRIYGAVVFTTAAVILLCWMFSRHFA